MNVPTQENYPNHPNRKYFLTNAELEAQYDEAHAAAKKAGEEGYAKYIARGETEESARGWSDEDAGDAFDEVCRKYGI